MARKKHTSEPQQQAFPLRLEWRSPQELAENPLNWRRHPEAQMSALADVIGEVGWAGACLFNEQSGRLIDGHARRKLALAEGCEKVPVLIGSWTDEQERMILATLDPLAAMAEADKDRLSSLLADLATLSPELKSTLQDLAERSIPDGLGSVPLPTPGAGGDEFDATPEEQGPTRTSVGDLWVIGGKHRLLVGDCTVRENVERLMDGEKADLVATDPPYGVDFKRGQFITDPSRRSSRARGVGDDIAGDHRKADNQQEFIRMVFALAGECVRPACSVYMWSATLVEGSHSMLGLSAAGVHIQSQLVWLKNNLVLGIADYHWKHEICWYGWYEGATHRWFGERDKTTILEFARVASTEHPNEKPVNLISHMIGNSSLVGEIVYDPFLGSGTTLIAAHRLNRRCYGCEIEPRYADVILRRAEAEGLTVEKHNG